MKKNQMPQIALPADACELSGFTDKDTLELHAAEGVLVFLNRKMTALQMAKAIESLSSLSAELISILAAACGICDNCGDDPELCEECGCQRSPSECVDNCPLCKALLDDSQSIYLPEYVLEDARIPLGTKLQAFADDENGKIVVTPADIQNDLTDVPAAILEILTMSGICLAELDELILQGSIIYGR